MMTASKTIDTLVIAEDAPIGKLVWPVRTPEHAPAFTIAEVAVIRSAAGSYVRWTYENGATRDFKVGEKVACRF